MKKQLPLLIIITLFISSNLYAQEAKKDTSYWKKKTQFGANFSNGGFSDSWAPGGQSVVGINFFFNTKGEYAKDKTTWVNDLQLQYGTQNVDNKGARKSIDRIFFDTKVGRKLSKVWSLVGGLNFQSQFTAGYKYSDKFPNGKQISGLFAPAFVSEYVGFEWKPKPHFNIVFAPGALRQTIVSDDDVRLDESNVPQKVYGVDVGKTVQNDIGIMQIVASYDKDVAQNINLKFRYSLFMDANKIAHMDNRLDAKLAAKINKYFSATFDLIGVYDDDLGTSAQRYNIQTAYNIGLGFLYTF
jgi:Protein of unknown function (DUF3078)